MYFKRAHKAFEYSNKVFIYIRNPSSAFFVLYSSTIPNKCSSCEQNPSVHVQIPVKSLKYGKKKYLQYHEKALKGG